jgi:hypothetical protein
MSPHLGSVGQQRPLGGCDLVHAVHRHRSSGAVAGLPEDSLAPLAQLIWNKDPTRFCRGCEEPKLLSERLVKYYPPLASLVQGVIPRLEGTKQEPRATEWRSSRPTRNTTSKVFTSYYRQTNFLHPRHSARRSTIRPICEVETAGDRVQACGG